MKSAVLAAFEISLLSLQPAADAANAAVRGPWAAAPPLPLHCSGGHATHTIVSSGVGADAACADRSTRRGRQACCDPQHAP